MKIDDRKRVLYQVIKHLMDKGFVDFGKLSSTLPKDTLDTLNDDEKLRRFVEVLDLHDIEKSLDVKKPLTEDFIWR